MKKLAKQIVQTAPAKPWHSLISEKNGDIFIKINAKPNAKQTQLSLSEDQLFLQLAAQPKEGEANKEVLRFLSQELGVGKTFLTVHKGTTSKEKTVKLDKSAQLSVGGVISALETALDSA